MMSKKRFFKFRRLKKIKAIVNKHKLIDQMMGFSVGVYSHDESVKTGQIPADYKYIVLSLNAEFKKSKSGSL